MGLPGLRQGAAHGGPDPSAPSGNAFTQLNFQQINVAPVLAANMDVDPQSFNDLANVATANANNATQLGAAVSKLHNTTANLAAGMESLRANHANVNHQLAQIAEMLDHLTRDATGTTTEAVASAARTVENAASQPASPPPGMAPAAGAAPAAGGADDLRGKPPSLAPGYVQ
eukprot:gene262-11096_t